MGMKLFALNLAFFLSMHPSLAVAQEITAQHEEGSAIRAVPVDEELIVEMKTGRVMKGKFSRVSDRTLFLYRKNRNTD